MFPNPGLKGARPRHGLGHRGGWFSLWPVPLWAGAPFCLDPGNGKVLMAGAARTGPYATFLSFPGHVLTLSHQGRLTVFKAFPKAFRPVANYALSKHSTWAAPVLLQDGVLVKDADTLSLWTFR